MDNYYQHPYCSNSDLTALDNALTPLDRNEFQAALQLGTLVDAFLTEPSKIDFIKNECGGFSFTKEQIKKARVMAESFKTHAVAQNIWRGSEFQKVFTSIGVPFTYGDIKFQLNCRCKYDGFKPITNWGWDLKTTIATNERELLYMIDRFSWDRAAEFYMRVSNTTKFVILGLSKKQPHNVIPIVINKGDRISNQGAAKLEDLAFKYYMLKDNAKQTI